VVWHMASWTGIDGPHTAADVARRPPPRLSPDQPVRQAAVEMFDSVGDAVVVTDGERVVGILTANDLVDLLAAGSPGDQAPGEQGGATPTAGMPKGEARSR
jgi:CBS domain-containing protein